MKKISVLLFLSAMLLNVSLTANAGVESEPNSFRSTSNELSVNDVMIGSFTLDSEGYHDYYRFTLTEPSTNVTVRFRNKTGYSLKTYISLRDSTKSLQSGEINAFDTTELSFTQNLGAGVYYVYCFNISKPTTVTDYVLSVGAKISVTPSIVGSVGLVDLNKNAKKDIAVLRILEDASSVVEIRDGSTGEIIKVIQLPYGESLKPVSIAGFNDKNIAVIIYDGLTQTNTQYIFNAQTGAQTTFFPLD